MILLSHTADQYATGAQFVSAIDGSRIRNAASLFVGDCDGDDLAEARREQLAALRRLLVLASGGEAAYEELVSRIENGPSDFATHLPCGSIEKRTLREGFGGEGARSRVEAELYFKQRGGDERSPFADCGQHSCGICKTLKAGAPTGERFGLHRNDDLRGQRGRVAFGAHAAHRYCAHEHRA